MELKLHAGLILCDILALMQEIGDLRLLEIPVWRHYEVFTATQIQMTILVVILEV